MRVTYSQSQWMGYNEFDNSRPNSRNGKGKGKNNWGAHYQYQPQFYSNGYHNHNQSNLLSFSLLRHPLHLHFSHSNQFISELSCHSNREYSHSHAEWFPLCTSNKKLHCTHKKERCRRLKHHFSTQVYRPFISTSVFGSEKLTNFYPFIVTFLYVNKQKIHPMNRK